MPDYILPKITVSRAYRTALLNEYPNLNKNPAYWLLLEYLLFANWRDESQELILPSAFCAMMEGRHQNSNYSAYRFLEAFSKDVAYIYRTSGYNFRNKKSRTIASVSWSEHALALTQAEKRNYLPSDRVWLSTGNKYRRADEASFRRHTQSEALGMMETAGCQEAFELLSYLNNLASNRFTAIKQHLNEACEVALRVSRDVDQQLRILKNIEAQSQPFYRAGDTTSRIFAINQSFLGLRREVRKILTQDWISCDLRSAQLAIIAKLWELPILESYLREGGKIWPDLCSWMELAYSEANKGVMKNVLYAIIFGAGRDRLKNQLSSDFDSPAAALKRLATHPILRALFFGRTKQLKKIQGDKFGTDAFGKKHFLQSMQVEGKPYSYDSSRSILAIIAQSYELKLLYPVVRSAIESKGVWAITMWLHDGFCFDVVDKRHRERWCSHLQTLVAKEAENLGICTELEVEF